MLTLTYNRRKFGFPGNQTSNNDNKGLLSVKISLRHFHIKQRGEYLFLPSILTCFQLWDVIYLPVYKYNYRTFWSQSKGTNINIIKNKDKCLRLAFHRQFYFYFRTLWDQDDQHFYVSNRKHLFSGWKRKNNCIIGVHQWPRRNRQCDTFSLFYRSSDVNNQNRVFTEHHQDEII